MLTAILHMTARRFTQGPYQMARDLLLPNFRAFCAEQRHRSIFGVGPEQEQRNGYAPVAVTAGRLHSLCCAMVAQGHGLLHMGAACYTLQL